jgi:hypothetical protein
MVTVRFSVLDFPAQVALYAVEPGPGEVAAFAHFDEIPLIAVATDAVEREQTLTDFADAAAEEIPGIAVAPINKSGKITRGILIARSTP